MPDPSLIAKSRGPAAPSQIAQRGMGILLVLALIFVIIVLLVYGGVFLYRNSLQTTLDDSTRELAKLEERFEPDKIRKIAEVDKGLAVAKTLLSSHVYSSNVFKFLEENTSKETRYKNFTYTSNPPQLTLSTEVEGFTGLKRQLDIFEEIPIIKTAVFSGITRTENDDTVGFSLTLTFDDALLRYNQ